MAARFVNIDHDTPLLLPPDCRARYKLRQQTVEPVFGIIKEARGFRRFSLRGQAKASLEWTLVSLAYKTASRSTPPERNCSSRESAVNRRPAPRQQPPTRPHARTANPAPHHAASF